MSGKDKPDLLDWLGLRWKPDYSKTRPLGILISVAVFILVAILVGSTALEFLRAVLDIDKFKGQEAQSAAIRNTGLVLAAMIGVPFVVWRSVVAQKQVDVAEQGQITDRINKAVEGLGAEKTVRRQRKDPNGLLVYELDSDGNLIFSKPIFDETSEPNIEVRVGAIYALERIAQDSDRDHIQIMEILCAYIRENAPAAKAEPYPFDSEEAPKSDEVRTWAAELEGPTTDIRIALEVIGRRSQNQIALERVAEVRGSKVGYRLDLRDTCLQRADISELNFEHALFDGAQMQGADLSGAQIQGGNLSGARMQGAGLSGAQMQGAHLSGAQMQGAILYEARMQGADLIGAQMQGAFLDVARMQGADLIGAQMQGAILSGARMQRVNLLGAEMDEGTSLSAATLQGAALREIDFTTVSISQEQLDGMFGDGSVKLPVTLNRPDWPVERLNYFDFDTQWRAWQKKIGTDPAKDTS